MEPAAFNDTDILPVRWLGRVRYGEALALQRATLEAQIAARQGDGSPGRRIGQLFLLEHDPVITVTRRPGAAAHLLASPQRLAELGVELCETDRGGDVTYHGPGQLVAYPILDLNALGLRIHSYMRFLETLVIDLLGEFGIAARRDAGATGVWVDQPDGAPAAKICAMGVRVSRWVSMHGLALNVDPDLGHFGLIVPCGLVGRPVTSMRRELGAACPALQEVAQRLAERFVEGARSLRERATAARA